MNNILILVLGFVLGSSTGATDAVSGTPIQPSTLAAADDSVARQGSTAGSKMTNAEVIKLVTAGLSDQVVTASIRQAATVEFDLTPTGLIALKKAGISDAVIVVMQEKSHPPQAPAAAAAETGTDADPSLAGLARAVESGKEVSLPVKYNSVCPNCSGTSRLFAMTPMIAVNMVDGVLSITNRSFAFKGTVGGYDFNISHDKVLELDDQPERSSRIHVKVAVMNKKGKEDKKDYYFYNSGARGMGDATVGGPGQSIVCTGCDDSMHNVYKLLSSLRGR